MEPVNGIVQCVTLGGCADTVAIMEKTTRTTKATRSTTTILTFLSNKEYTYTRKKQHLKPVCGSYYGPGFVGRVYMAANFALRPVHSEGRSLSIPTFFFANSPSQTEI